eukprot:CAMPEP_0201489282 /NCGR_PEP_ID=MMETSP0151_2-20130828/21788_1 /ASSEMBLY_ACC=CAM_ASM_000257 /TAXON_ID=200890 /ORGANISM="Paramoeba atlantica, Strain 621/1 / CCAP 1560/9" /LENGTH=273 /DNA_ID=CAMNT_0047874819 /DNA_START=45 /DNA_END=866 /DNA_ORIENTATION=+
MGNFRGHFGPATFFLIGGIYFFLKASMFRCTHFMRFTYKGLLIPGLIGVVGSFCLGFGEFMVSDSPWLPSHRDHFRLNFSVFFLSVVYVLHLTNILKGSMWGLFPALAFFVDGLVAQMHHQNVMARSMAHQFAGSLFYSFALAYTLEYLTALYFQPPKEMQKEMENERKAGCNGVYLNPSTYQTPFPMLTSFTLTLNAVWWYQMAFYLFNPESGYSDSVLDDHMAGTMLVASMIYNTLIFTAVGYVVAFLVGQWVDRIVSVGKSSRDHGIEEI